MAHCTRLLIIAILICCFFASAQEQIRYTAEMTYLPAGSDIASMGDAGVVLPLRATASLWNPAASSLQQRYEFSAEVADLYHGLSRQACFPGIPVQGNIGALAYLHAIFQR